MLPACKTLTSNKPSQVHSAFIHIHCTCQWHKQCVNWKPGGTLSASNNEVHGYDTQPSKGPKNENKLNLHLLIVLWWVAFALLGEMLHVTHKIVVSRSLGSSLSTALACGMAGMQDLAFLQFVCLLFYILAASKVMSGQLLTCHSTHSW